MSGSTVDKPDALLSKELLAVIGTAPFAVYPLGIASCDLPRTSMASVDRRVRHRRRPRLNQTVFCTEEIAPGFEQVFAAVVDLLERLPAPNL
ncbi:MAG TPA: hypothetical protein VI094_09800 [Propionibacteriaceae bacterium]